MNKEIVTYLLSQKSPRLYEPGEILFSQGDPADEFYYLVSGLSLTFFIHEDGRERNVLITWPDRIFGASTFFEKVPRRSSAIAIKQCNMLTIDRELYQKCCARFPEFTDVLLCEVSKDLGILFDELADITLMPAAVRVARFLTRRFANGQHTGTAEEPIIDCTQDFIASVLGVSRVSVNTALASMADKGWLSTSYGVIHIRNTAALLEFAYGNYGENVPLTGVN